MINLLAFLVIGYITLKVLLDIYQIYYIKNADVSDADLELFSIDIDYFNRSNSYNISKLFISIINVIITGIILSYFIFLGGIQDINNNIEKLNIPYVNQELAIVIFFVVFMTVINIPIGLYKTFYIEEKFGFNKTKTKTFISDVLIDLTTTAAVTFVIMYISLWIISALGTSWWFWLWVFLSSVIIIMSALGPLLQQLKNKFSPLEDKKLKVIIEKLLKKCGFESQGLFIMNGSLRSSHGNAFFGGFGKTKRIIFFDTLLDKLTHKEIEAVIAHELGHFKMNHVKKFMAIMITILFLSLYVLGGLKDNPLFYEVLGVEIMSDANFLMLFNFVLLNYLFFFIKPAMAFLSRKNEYEADAYACLVAKGDDLKRSLTKLYRDNASTLTPDPLYSSFNHSHPPALMRIKAIDKL